MDWCAWALMSPRGRAALRTALTRVNNQASHWSVLMLRESRKVAERPEAATLWTRLGCSRCRYQSEHPGQPTPSDLDRGCALCGAMLGAVTVYRVSVTVVRAPDAKTAAMSIHFGSERSPHQAQSFRPPMGTKWARNPFPSVPGLVSS